MHKIVEGYTKLTTDGKKTDESNKEELQKQLLQVICICKGISLGRVLKGLEGSETVHEVNLKTGCGSGGCRGERCGPKIKILLAKKKAAEQRKRSINEKN